MRHTDCDAFAEMGLNLDWVLRVDASDKAVGAVLYQERPSDFGVVDEPIGFASQKFSNIASRWDAFKKEVITESATSRTIWGVSHFSWRQTIGTFSGLRNRTYL